MNRNIFIKVLFTKLFILICAFNVTAQDKLLDVIGNEVNTYYQELKGEKIPPYFLSCRADDVKTTIVDASFGVINSVSQNRLVAVLPEIRVGNRDFDNFHNNTPGTTISFMTSPEPILIPYNATGGEAAIKQILWNEFTSRYKYGLGKYLEMRSAKGVRTEEGDVSPDFTPAKAVQYYEPPLDYQKQDLDVEKSKELAKKYSSEFLKYPNIIRGSVIIRQELIRKYFVSTEGAKIAQNITHNFLLIRASVKADDGMDLPLAITYFAFDQKDFPNGAKVAEAIRDLADRLNKLRVAPLVQPFTGPALLSGSASGVFFHEIFGHRIEGQKMKNDTDGQTFKKMIGSMVLPSALSVYDDPSLSNYKGQDLNGYYKYDDQGVSGKRVTVVKNGILNDFLMTRTAIEGFPESNGHARAEIGYDPSSRQSNLIVETSAPKTDQELKTLLREEAKKQGKEYGFYFKEVTGGFTMTGRSSPNAFNVTPLEVYRIYVDGREDELVRGVDLIGTPLSMFSNIVCAGGAIESFIGSCGSISGFVPVSAISPAILVSKVELQMKPKSSNLPPILTSPFKSEPYSQEGKEIIFGAMAKEAQRGMDSLKLPGSPKPFYISYSVVDKDLLEVRSTLGSVLYSKELPSFRNISVKLLLGDYNNTSATNFSTEMTSSKASAENNATQLRRNLWIATDASYKDAARTLKQKSSWAHSKSFPDFIKNEPIVKETADYQKIVFKREDWEKRLNELSSVFLKYPDITNSFVNYSASNTLYYFYNTEGSQFVQPATLSTIIIGASILDEYGHEYKDKTEFIAVNDSFLPSNAIIVSKVESMIGQLREISKATVMEEYYSGPVLFEDQAVYKLFMENLVMKNGIIATRDNINMNSGAAKITKIDKSLVSRIGKKLVDQKLTVKDLSGSSLYNGTPLPGFIQIDAEGIKKRGEITIIEKGLLKNLISGRSPADSGMVPTSSLRFSTIGTDVSYSMTPALLVISASGGKSPEKLKKELLKIAEGEGLKYAYIIRRYPELRSDISTLIYRVNVKNGDETLIKSAALLSIINLSILKRIRAVSNSEQTFSQIFDNNPITVTLPKAILLDDIELNNLSYKKDKPLPIINPLLRN